MTVELTVKMTVERRREEKREKKKMVQQEEKKKEISEVQQSVLSEGEKSSISPEESWLLRESKVKRRNTIILNSFEHLNPGVFIPKV